MASDDIIKRSYHSAIHKYLQYHFGQGEPIKEDYETSHSMTDVSGTGNVIQDAAGNAECPATQSVAAEAAADLLGEVERKGPCADGHMQARISQEVPAAEHGSHESERAPMPGESLPGSGCQSGAANSGTKKAQNQAGQRVQAPWWLFYPPPPPPPPLPPFLYPLYLSAPGWGGHSMGYQYRWP